MKDYLPNLLKKIEQSYKFSLSGNNKNRSAKKVDIIHGQISRDLQEFLESEYIVKTKETTGKEEIIEGRYIDKKVDVLVSKRSNDKQMAGIGFKFVLSSYQKNANNYFENMLGETANIRTNNTPYFQIIALLKHTPNITGSGSDKNVNDFTHLNKDHLKKFITISRDNTTSFYHTPLKTLLLVLDIKNSGIDFKDKISYKDYCEMILDSDFYFELSEIDLELDSGVILNDYNLFLEKTNYLIRGFD